jgi:hypothetical protein
MPPRFSFNSDLTSSVNAWWLFIEIRFLVSNVESAHLLVE